MPDGYLPEILHLIRDFILETKNPLGLSGKECAKWARDLDIPRGGETIIYTSCMYQVMSYSESLVEALSKFMGDPTSSLPVKFSKLSMKLKINPIKLVSAIFRTKNYDSVLRKAVAILNKIGVKFGYLYEEEPYSGALLYEYGFHDEFAEYSKEIYSLLKSKNVKKMIVLDPHTADLFKNVYPEFIDNFDIEVELFIEMVKEAIEKGKIRLKGSEDAAITFQDPCHYSRYLGIVDTPRVIIKSVNGVDFRDHPRSGELSMCCGGPIESLYPRLSKLMARNRVEELLSTGAKKIIVACPICLINFERAKSLVKQEYEIEDIIEYVFRHMGD
ncbi:MAG: (Fe-S)-binding protein [Candidatus Njordarchaeia archaeon]